ncbi:YciI family protein [Fulvimonas sp. R45]|uniref:YciI family protein n=1 Tax=Fulvimonas sp. R45 TaxID=3045937 RepID=UPI00265EC8B4|nr:YciI family protein [Fulvimonas sp. R45]MDO1529913.1 YciI family protein [Fulvimonas sp. R45]
MRCMVMVRATAESEASPPAMPSQRRLAEMNRFNEELMQAGVLLAGEGLRPSAAGARVRFAGDRRSVIDGPFAEAKELIAGFWLWQVRSMDEALAWAQRCPPPFDGECEIEIRPLFEAEDFGEALTPEVRASEERIRAALASKSA